MSGQWFLPAAAMGFLIVLGGCGEQNRKDAAAPAGVEPGETAAPESSGTARLERSGTKQGTLALEGSDEPFTFELFDSSIASLPVAFTTYVPQDMIAEPVGSGMAVRFVANFGGRRQDEAYIEVLFHPPATAESEARSLTARAAPGGAAAGREPGAAKQFAWSLEEHNISYRSKMQGRIAGVVALGKHGDRFFQVILHYPEEYSDGFSPRAYRILEEWRWADTGQGL